MLACVGSRCWIKMNAMPVRGGRAVSSRRKASRPPAEAPRPTTGKLSCPNGERRLGDERRAGGERAAPGFCGPFSIIYQFYHNARHRRDNGVNRQCPRPVEDGALLSRRFDHSLQLSSPYEVVDGPSAYLTRDGESTVKNRTETRLTAPIFRAK
jgi:hypothetical protein